MSVRGDYVIFRVIMKRTHPDDGLNAVSGGLQNDNKSDGILFFNIVAETILYFVYSSGLIW